MVNAFTHVVLLGLLGLAAYAVALPCPTRIMPLGASIVEEVRSPRQPRASPSLILLLSLSRSKFPPAYLATDVLACLRMAKAT